MEEHDDEPITLKDLGMTREEANAFRDRGPIYAKDADHFYLASCVARRSIIGG